MYNIYKIQYTYKVQIKCNKLFFQKSLDIKDQIHFYFKLNSSRDFFHIANLFYFIIVKRD